MRTTILFFTLFSAISANTFASGTKNVSLKMSEISTGLNNSTQIYFAAGTSTSFISPEDSRKISDTLQSSIYSLTSNGIACSSNGFGDLATSVAVKIGYSAKQTGAYTFSVSTGAGVDAGSVIVLEDRLLGVSTNLLLHAYTIQLAQAGQNENRFYLHISAAPALSVVASDCDNNNGVIVVNEDGAVRWSSVLLFDSNQVRIQEVHDTTTSFRFENLSEGKHFMAFFTSEGYMFVKIIHVSSQRVQLTISASAIKADVGQTIQFYSVASNASRYSWDFGDSTIITDIANPSYDYFEQGNYTVTLHATNDFQCSATAYITMPVGLQIATSVRNIASEGISLYGSKKNIVITNNNLTASNSTCEVYNLSGQMITSTPVTSAHFIVSMENQPSDIYLVQMKTTNGNFTQKIFVTNN